MTIVLVLYVVVWFFLPTIIVHQRSGFRKLNVEHVLVNAVFGMTMVGWAVLLRFALKNESLPCFPVQSMHEE